MNRRAILSVVPFLTVAGTLPRPAAAQPGPTTPAEFVRRLGHDFTATIAGARTVEQRRELLAPFLAGVVDMDGAARFCLGAYWTRTTPEQQRSYLRLFARSLTAAVAARADTYAEGKSEVTVLPEQPSGEGTAVRTIVRNAGQPQVNVTWIIDTVQRPFRIVDVQAEGISLRQTLRSDYTSFLRAHDGDIDTFLQALRARTG